MTKTKHPLTKEEFYDIFHKVPRLTVEILIINNKKQVLLTKRSIEPCKNYWHLPGGTVHYGESLKNAVARIAKQEINLSISDSVNVGYIEYPSHFNKKLGYPVGIVFMVTKYSGEIKLNDEALDYKWFDKLPTLMHPDQDVYLVNNKYLKA